MEGPAGEKALFIPLKREYFEAFESGKKNTEYRKRGPRWNVYTCRIGRAVTLSLGYGKARRLTGFIRFYRESTEITRTKDWINCYGNSDGVAVCIGIEITRT